MAALDGICLYLQRKPGFRQAGGRHRQCFRSGVPGPQTSPGLHAGRADPGGDTGMPGAARPWRHQRRRSSIGRASWSSDVCSSDLTEKNDLWLLWMEYAFTFSENQDSDKLVAATGSAFDLACLARKHHPDCMQVELTLAAILVCRALRDRGDISAAEH